MTDPITGAARATAERLSAEYGPSLVGDVDAVLLAQRPVQYLDPVSLASLIVTIATLAWTIYSDQRKRAHGTSPSVVARQVRVELRKHGVVSNQETDRITEIVVTEIIQAVRDPH